MTWKVPYTKGLQVVSYVSGRPTWQGILGNGKNCSSMIMNGPPVWISPRQIVALHYDPAPDRTLKRKSGALPLEKPLVQAECGSLYSPS